MAFWLRLLTAIIVFCHGFIYVRIGSLLPGPVKGWNGRSWLLGGLVTDAPLVSLSRAVHVVAGVTIIACAVAIGFGHGSWRLLAIAGGSIGIVAFAIFWDGQARLLFDEGVIGALVSLILVICAFAI
jgi:hypothetical protein